MPQTKGKFSVVDTTVFMQVLDDMTHHSSFGEISKRDLEELIELCIIPNSQIPDYVMNGDKINQISFAQESFDRAKMNSSCKFAGQCHSEGCPLSRKECEQYQKFELELLKTNKVEE
jgi:hypothetical protein